jgi:fucokinase
LERISPDKQFEWVTCCSPCRLDLSGAWSDTPPITYECPGGSCVTNVAILVNGKKPIGAKAKVVKRTNPKEPLCVKIVMQDSADDSSNQTSFEFLSLDDFKDYNKPQAVGCLVKAVCVFTKLVDLESGKNLSEQLEKHLNGSLELRTWTGLAISCTKLFSLINFTLFTFSSASRKWTWDFEYINW